MTTPPSRGSRKAQGWPGMVWGLSGGAHGMCSGNSDNFGAISERFRVSRSRTRRLRGRTVSDGVWARTMLDAARWQTR